MESVLWLDIESEVKLRNSQVKLRTIKIIVIYT